MANYHDNVANATRRAYLQSASITNVIGFITRVITQVTVEDSPDGQKLLDEANEDLDRALKRVESARQKVLEATAATKSKDAKIAALVGHLTESVEMVVEHEADLADVATIAGNAEVYATYDPDFSAKMFSLPDKDILKQAFGKLDEDRLKLIREVLREVEPPDRANLLPML